MGRESWVITLAMQATIVVGILALAGATRVVGCVTVASAVAL